MAKFLKYFILVVFALVLVMWVYIQSHQPVLRGKLQVEGLKSEVEVYFDEYGIPHIYGDSREDAYRAFGYLHAQDRLFQMELMRRVGLGRLSEILGEETKETDAFFRTLGTHRKAATDAERFSDLPENVRLATNAYLAGINAFIKNGKPPLEYKVLGVEPEPFDIEDLYGISAYMAYSFAYALRTDPLVEKMAANLSPDHLRSLDLAVTTDLFPPDTSRIDTLAMEEKIAAALKRPFFPGQLPIPTLQGSNNWALGASRTLSGKPILANDTHIRYSSPCAWYEAHIEYPGFGFYGNFLAGVPVAMIGHSRNHAWGLTMFEDDDSDFFRERFSDGDSSYTVYQDSLKAPVNRFLEKIGVKGGEDTVITVYETTHGPIINAFLPVEMDEPVSMYWNYLANENALLESFYRMNHAADLKDFRDGMKKIASPGLNIAYADASGNIALWSVSKLIERPDSVDGKQFADGFRSDHEYLGFYDFERNPTLENPPSGIVYSANQHHDTTKGIDYPGYYAPPNRADRIASLLEENFPATVENMMGVSLDVVSDVEVAVAKDLCRVLRNSDRAFSGAGELAYERLEMWDGSHQLADVAPTIYYKLLYHILRYSMMDELGEDNFEDLLNTHLVKRSYPKLISMPDSPWWDDQRTPDKRETRENIVVKAFDKTMMEIEEELGVDPEDWKWEYVHFVEHPHPFSEVAVLDRFFHVGPFPAPGGNETVNNSGFIFNGDGRYTAHYGPAMRIIIDFADVENAVSILPTGNSGNVISPHYSDQAEMYVAGEFRKMKMNREEITNNGNLLRLEP